MKTASLILCLTLLLTIPALAQDNRIGCPGGPGCPGNGQTCADYTGVFFRNGVFFTSDPSQTDHYTGDHDHGGSWDQTCDYVNGQWQGSYWQCIATGVTAIWSHAGEESGSTFPLSYTHRLGWNQNTVGTSGVTAYSAGDAAFSVTTCYNSDSSCTNESIGYSGLTPSYYPHLGSTGLVLWRNDYNTGNLNCPDETGNGGSPIVILQSGDYDHAFTDVAHGVTFDFFHAGEPVQMSWTDKDADAWFLVLNRFGNESLSPKEVENNRLFIKRWNAHQITAGKFHVSSSKEMFGDNTMQTPPDNSTGWSANGFTALAWFDDPAHGGNGNGMIDEGDAVYPLLMLWRDTAHNGRSEDGEWMTLKQAGKKYISLRYIESPQVDKHGNKLKYEGQIGTVDGAQAAPRIFDVFFVIGKR
jgi:hypothetical protein